VNVSNATLNNKRLAAQFFEPHGQPFVISSGFES
jgi:hypothetical protein